MVCMRGRTPLLLGYGNTERTTSSSKAHEEEKISKGHQSRANDNRVYPQRTPKDTHPPAEVEPSNSAAKNSRPVAAPLSMTDFCPPHPPCCPVLFVGSRTTATRLARPKAASAHRLFPSPPTFPQPERCSSAAVGCCSDRLFIFSFSSLLSKSPVAKWRTGRSC
jgi:hypothetical protein